jgi:hypothetical protein
MGITRKTKLAAFGAAALAVAGGSAAIAATGSGTPAEESKAIVDAAAQDLGVTSTELDAALKQALITRVEAQLTAGSITEAQATALKARINSDSFAIFGPLAGPHGDGFGYHHGAGLTAASTYLGVSEIELRTSLQSGNERKERRRPHRVDRRNGAEGAGGGRRSRQADRGPADRDPVRPRTARHRPGERRPARARSRRTGQAGKLQTFSGNGCVAVTNQSRRPRPPVIGRPRARAVRAGRLP